MSHVRSLLPAVVLALLPSIARAEAPPDKATCVASLDRAQKLQSERRLRAARAELVTCAAASCPVVVREDCARSLLELDAALPSIVVSVTDEKGADVADARVSVDGEDAPSALDGRALPLDPGPHTIRVERPGRPPLDVAVVVRQGEKNRSVLATFASPTSERKRSAEPTRSPLPVVPVVLAGVGGVALGTALVFRVQLDSRVDALRDSCAPACSAADRDALSGRLVATNIALGLGVTALAAAAATWIFGTRH